MQNNVPKECTQNSWDLPKGTGNISLRFIFALHSRKPIIDLASYKVV